MPDGGEQGDPHRRALRPRGVTGPSRRWTAVGGIAGPVAFAAAWAVLGAGQPDYSPVDEPISRLAAVGSPTRVPMTAGLLTFGAGVAVYALGAPTTLPGGASFAAGMTALASVGVAVLPLEPGRGSGAHDLAAGIAYLSLAAAPLLAARALSARGRLLPARLSVLTGCASAAALLASAVVPRGVGLLQRLGLTLGHAWIAASATSTLRDRRR